MWVWLVWGDQTEGGYCEGDESGLIILEVVGMG